MILRLAAGDASASVDPAAGGRLASLVVGGRERLVTQPDASAVLPTITWGSFAMLPWVGRMRDGHLAWRGLVAQLPRDFGDHAIHGATHHLPWDVLEADGHEVELACHLGPSASWPFAAEARQRIALAADAIEQTIEVRADEPMPVAAGWHPWFRREAGERMDVAVPAPSVLETTADLIPTGGVLAVDALTDLRGRGDIGDRRLDHAYVGLEGSSRIAWPDLEIVVEASPLGSVVVFTTPRSVCLEPQSAWPDAIRLDAEGLPTGLVVLETGASFVMTTRWSWRAIGASARA